MLLAALIALVAGGCNAGLIALVNAVLSGALTASTALVGGFVLLGIVRLMAHFFAQVTLTRFAQMSTANLRHDLVEKILGVPLPHMTIPVRPGRELARLIEVAALHTKLRRAGHNPAKELNDRLVAQMATAPHGL